MPPNPHQYRFSRRSHHFGHDSEPTIWNKFHIDPWLILLLLTISLIGLSVLYSASTQNTSLLAKQIGSFSIAFVIMIMMAQIPPSLYRAFTPVVYLAGFAALVYVEIFGEIRMGAKRWIDIPVIGGSVQPSEFMKLAMPMMCAWFLSKRGLPPNAKTVFVTLAIILVPVLFIAIQPDLGTSLLVASSGFFVLFLAGLPWIFIGSALLLLALFTPVVWQFLLHEYQRNRILTLLNPESDLLGKGWNIFQSKIAIGSGGTFGKGYLQGSQSQLEFLPEAHTDFIIAAFSEEFGLVGVIFLILIYSLLLIRALYIALKHPDNYGRLLAGAIALSLFVYVFVNMGMVGGILPVVGVPLPFMSYGGTALITLMAGFGILMSIHTHGNSIKI